MPLRSFADLSPLHKKICIFVAHYRATHPGLSSPSYDEIGAHCRLGDAGVDYHLRQLQEKGWIQRRPTQHRCVQLTDTLLCAMLPALTPFVSDGRFTVLPSSIPFQQTETPLVAMMVQGESFQRDHICHGDCLLLHLRHTCRTGDVVVLQQVSEGSPILLKRFSHSSASISLISLADDQETILVSPEQWEREWRVLGVIETIIRHIK